MDLNIASATSVSFGPFRLFPARRLLLDRDQPLCLGSRALDILLALVERTGELVDKKDLMRRVWPDTNVVENNLSVHVAALRRALRDGTDGNRYIITIPGRGYCFAAPPAEMTSPSRLASGKLTTHALRSARARFADRAREIRSLAEQLRKSRLLTIVGPAGTGKTSLAMALAKKLLFEFAHDTWIVDLASLDDGRFVPVTVAAALGVQGPQDDPLLELFTALDGRPALLVLDNCDQVSEAVADLVSALLSHTDGLRILVTSREPLRINGERIHRPQGMRCPQRSSRWAVVRGLDSLAVPPFADGTTVTSGEFARYGGDKPAPIPTVTLILVATSSAATEFRMWHLVEDRRHTEAVLGESERQLRRARDDLATRVEGRTAELRRSEAYLAQAQRLTRTGSWVRKPRATKMLYCSEELLKILGFDPKQGVPSEEEFARRVHPDDVEIFRQRERNALSKKSDHTIHFRIVLPDGTLKYIESTGRPVFNETGEIVEFFGSAVDITERTRAQKEQVKKRPVAPKCDWSVVPTCG